MILIILLEYVKTRKKVKNYKIYNKRVIDITNSNLEKYKVSTSLLYILQNKYYHVWNNFNIIKKRKTLIKTL